MCCLEVDEEGGHDFNAFGERSCFPIQSSGGCTIDCLFSLADDPVNNNPLILTDEYARSRTDPLSKTTKLSLQKKR
jgi:hypothetical protein